MDDHKGHWNQVYDRKDAADVSWFQPHLEVSLALIDAMRLPPSAHIVDIGGGASTLVDDLLARGFRRLTVLDISGAALDSARRRLGPRAGSVTWMEEDITEAEFPADSVDVWHDRAVFHFLTDAESRARYVRLAAHALHPGGHIIVATFSKQGPEQCSGLDVARYDPDELHAEFGAPFEQVEHVAEMHETPWGGQQAFTYCYCRRK